MPKYDPPIGKIRVSLGNRSYEITVGENLITNAYRYIKPFLQDSKLFVITDNNVADIWLESLEKSFQKAEIRIQKLVLPSGEKTKSFNELENLIEKILSIGVSRKSTLIALGGGVIGDITGFAASILLRGINFIQIPTTLLSQVDSSVGGKTGINTPFGKNLLGTFYQPRLVLSDISSLKTLPKRQFLSGYSELVKHGLIGNLKFFEWCEKNGTDVLNGNPRALKYAILESCKIKANLVGKDEKEAGLRALLNLGHTFGHALEAEANYSNELLHGEAVAMGIILAFKLSNRLGICPTQEVDRVVKHFNSVGLPTDLLKFDSIVWDKEKIFARMKLDKKVSAGQILFILANQIGDTFISDVASESDVKAILELALNS